MQLEPALEALEAVMEHLKLVLDARVYVALGRGLWDCTARDVFDYVEDLQEGEQHKVRDQLQSRWANPAPSRSRWPAWNENVAGRAPTTIWHRGSSRQLQLSRCHWYIFWLNNGSCSAAGTCTLLARCVHCVGEQPI